MQFTPSNGKNLQYTIQTAKDGRKFLVLCIEIKDQPLHTTEKGAEIVAFTGDKGQFINCGNVAVPAFAVFTSRDSVNSSPITL